MVNKEPSKPDDLSNSKGQSTHSASVLDRATEVGLLDFQARRDAPKDMEPVMEPRLSGSLVQKASE